VIRRLFTIALLVVVVGGAVAVGRLFLWPPTSTPKGADAVVLFVGGKGERLDTALALMRQGVAKNLVIPNGLVATWPQANALCRRSTGFKVFCPDPDPDTTRGEARAISTVARQQGWQHMVMVTSTYHVTRAKILLSRCFTGSIDARAADPGLAVPRHVARISHEVAGLAEAMLVNSGC
jgi:uncharacterized SAM-binding protein YcdF (DUF218 family)